MNNHYRHAREAAPSAAVNAVSSVSGGQLAWSDELAAENPVETDEDDEYHKMLTVQ